MDRKTLALILTEVVLIVGLVVVVAMDFNSKPQVEGVAESHVAEEAPEAVAEEGASEEEAAEAVVAKAEEVEEAEEAEEAEVKEEKHAKKAVAKKEEAAKPAKKAAAPAKAAGGEVADVIPLDNPAYAKHTKGIVQFTHKKHYTEYKATCGECHHDENAEPLDLKEGDAVQGCIECHPKASKAPKTKKGEPKLTDSEKMEYHAEALHANCINCHKEFNKKNNTKAAPTSCGKCHPKTEK